MVAINPYGRQIFLTKKEIHELKALIGLRLEDLADKIRSLETDNDNGNKSDARAKFEAKQEIVRRNEERQLLLKLDKKLFYYVPKAG